MANSSLTISFISTTGSKNLFIDLELDDDKNNGETSFLFGETVHFKMYTNCANVSFFPSEGLVLPEITAPTNEETDHIIEQLIFTQPPVSAGGKVKDNTVSLNHAAIDGSFSAVVLGTGNAGYSVSVDDVDKKQANGSDAGPGVFTAEYDSLYTALNITGPAMPGGWDPDETYPVVIVVVGT